MTTIYLFREYYLLFTLIILLLFPGISVFAQPSNAGKISDHSYVVEREYTTENGLPGNGVNSIFQDRNGYIWAATYNGLVRFNGLDFEIYNTTNLANLETNRFTIVKEDHDGNIWAGLEFGGFIKIGQVKDSTVSYSIDQQKFGPNVKTTDIVFDAENTPWIGTSTGVFTIKNGELIHFNHTSNQHVNHLYYFKGSIYVLFVDKLVKLLPDGSTAETLAELRGDNIYFENSTVDQLQNVIRLMDFHFINDDLYLMTEAGLIRHNGEPEVIFTRDDVEQAALHGFLPNQDKLYIYGRDGIFSTSPSGGDYIYYNRDSTIDLMVDHEESLWAATMSNGLIQFVSTPIYQGSEYEVLDEQGTTAILLSSDGSILIGANCDGIYHFSNDSFQRYGEEDGFENECVWSLMEQDDGTLWAGTWGGGVYYRPPGSTTFERFEPEIFNDTNVFLSIFEDSDGHIWFGSYYNGLYVYDGSQTIEVTDQNNRKLAAVRKIFESDTDDILIATDEGIGVLTGNKIVIPEEINVLETTNFRTISLDSEGRYWFGSYGGGMVIYQPGEEARVLTTAEGLYDNTISQLSFDEDGNLWLGGNLGVSFIEKNDIDPFLNGDIDHVRVSRLGVEEGMKIRETNGGFMPSSQLTPDGKLYIPTVQGVTVIDTNRMELNRKIPNVFIEEIEIDGEIFSSKEVNSIPHSTQRVIFRFSSLSYQNPKHNQYEYILEGFDNSWHNIGNKREAVYSSIPHGNYTLKVRASNNAGFWSTETASVSFEVVPPFWQTVWFYITCFALFLTFIVGGFRYRLRSIQKNNRQLQKMVEDRTEELSVSNRELKKHIEDKNKLQSILAHDLRNPFSAILGYIELIKNEFEEKGDHQHVEMMNMLLDSGKNTLNLLENLLHWSSSEEGGLEADFEAVNIAGLVDEAISMTDAQSTFKNIFVRNLIEEPHYVWADRNMILAVLRNLLSNAIKFSGRDSIVEISLQEKDEKVIISVEDTGVGIPEDELSGIFSSDSTIQQKVGTQGEKGIGMGLKLCKEFIDKHEEKIWVESTPRKGSTFSFS
ncbi:MAG: two-component regulator propeller domain-containing protein, partial [Balneolaceae bacterium]|nr:two-component regulator propeller domain-containing protein [Balneolaceae bacterium]